MTKDKKKKRERSTLRGKGDRLCRICGCKSGLIRSYGLNICRRCFREAASQLGFKKY